MGQLFANAARTKLSTGITASDTSLNLAGGGSLFPDIDTVNSSTFFKLVLQDETNIEIVYVNYHSEPTSPNVFSNLQRGKEGTTARDWPANTVVGLRMTAKDMADVNDQLTTLASNSTLLSQEVGQVKTNYVKKSWSDVSVSTPTDLQTLAINSSSNVFGKITLSAIVDWLRAKTVTWTGRQVFGITGYASEYALTTSASSYTFPLSNSNLNRLTVGADTAITLNFPGPGHYQLIVVQNSTGGYTPTIANSHRVAGGTALDWNKTANGETILSISYSGSIVYIGATKVGA